MSIFIRYDLISQDVPGMDRQQLISLILGDLSFIPQSIPGVFLYGSYATDSADARSDIDICIVSGKEFEPQDLQSLAWRNIKSEKYDIRIFELLPLFIQIRVLTQGILIYSPDKAALCEYLYGYRKLWDDQKWYQSPIPGA